MLTVVNFVKFKAKGENVALLVMGLQSASTTTELSSIDHSSVGSPFALRLFYTPLTNLHTLIYALSFSV